MKKEKKKKKKKMLNTELSFGGVSFNEKVIFTKNLSLMFKSGLTLSESLETIESQSTGKMKVVLSKVLTSIQSGQTLTDSLARHPKVFSDFFVNIVKAGEFSGSLETSLDNVAEQLQKDKELISKVKNALFYPVIILTAALIMGLVISFFVLPKITPLFKTLKVDLPMSTKVLMAFSSAIQHYGFYLLFAIIGVIVFIIWLFKREFMKPFVHLVLLKIPLIGNIIKKVNLARFCRTIGTLLKSGLNIDQAIKITEKAIDNYYYKKSIAQIYKRVSTGNKLADCLSDYKNIYPIITIKMIEAAEKTGKLEETFFYLSESYEAEVDNSTKSLSTVIEPVLLLFIGLMVAFLALSIITPIYKITGSVNH